MLSSVAPPPVQRNAQQNGPSLNTLVTDNSPKSTVNSTIQAPRRKVVVEGKLPKDALDVYLKLPHKHYHTGRVLSQVGKAYLAHQASPYSLKGMDVYSTVLYHLKEDMKLSYLAQEFISTDGLPPQSWCAMGNCYSLQKDHEAALIIFQRAVQLESRFAYAHTLCGHEYVSLDDFESGIKCYQKALRVDAKTL